MRDRLVDLSERCQGDAQIVLRIGDTGIECQAEPEVCDRFLEIPVIAQCIGEVELDDVVAWCQSSGFLELIDRASEVTADPPRFAKIVVRFGLIGRKTCCLLELLHAVWQAAGFEVRSTKGISPLRFRWMLGYQPFAEPNVLG